MSPVRLVPIIMVLVAGGALAGCDGDEESELGSPPDARSTLVRAAQSTLEAGPSWASMAVRSRAGNYRVRGRLDPADGYRFCGDVFSAPAKSFLLRLLWLEGRAGSHGTLTAPVPWCTRRAMWLDDHPPTLPLDGGAGAEDFLHAALTALTGLTPATVPSASVSRCGGSECVQAVVDFRALDRKPTSRDEDAWTLRPLLRSLGRHPITARIDSRGRVSRFVLAGQQVTVSVEISNYGEEARVPRVHVDAIE